MDGLSDTGADAGLLPILASKLIARVVLRMGALHRISWRLRMDLPFRSVCYPGRAVPVDPASEKRSSCESCQAKRALLARSYNCGMSSDRDRLQSLVDALPDAEVQVAISFLAELGEQEIVDVETAARLDQARSEPRDDVPLEEVRRQLGL